MDTQYTPAEGKLIVRFNGTPLTNCFHDTDCAPVNALCFINQTWAAFPSMCACLSSQEGLDCLERSSQGCLERSSQGKALLAFEIIALMVAVPAALIGLSDFMRVVRIRMKKSTQVKWLNVVEATSLFATLSLLFITMFLCFSILSLSIPRVNTIMVEGRTIKVSPLTMWPVLAVVSFFFGTLACLNLTLMWLSIAHDARRVRTTKNNFILRYKYSLAAYYLIFGVLLVFFTVSARLEAAFLVVIPAMLIIIVICLYGWYKLRFFKEGFGTESRAMLEKVEKTAIFLALSSIASLVFSAFMAQADRPDSKFTAVATGTVWLTIVLIQVSVMSFTHPSIVRRDTKSSSAVTADDGTLSHASSKHANLSPKTGHRSKDQVSSNFQDMVVDTQVTSPPASRPVSMIVRLEKDVSDPT